MQAMEQTHADVMLCGDVTEWTTCAYIRDAMQLGQNKAMIKLGHERSEEARNGIYGNLAAGSD